MQGLKNLIEALWWNNLRSPSSIKNIIQLVYSNKAAADEDLVRRIVQATENPRALDAFTSIVLAPKSRFTFNQMVDAVSASGIPVCLAYGREDPWVVPLWGQRLKRACPRATYFELSPAGHCPHHEAPLAMNKVVMSWIACAESEGQPSPLALGDSWTVTEENGSDVGIFHVSGRPRNIFERLDHLVWGIISR